MLLKSALLALSATLAAAVPTLEAKDNYFVNPATGNRFQIVGVAYQPGGSAGYKPQEGFDPLSRKDHCLRDAALMQILGVNTIRVYNLSPDLNHDECASIFNAAGIYMLLDVNSPLVGESLTDFNTWESYYASYLNRTFAVVEAFKSYPNTLAFFSGNEVISNIPSAGVVPPYVRAVTRDLKNYIAKHSTRPIPVGYSAADVRDVLFDSFNYFQCREEGVDNDMSHADLFALNSYSWCGNSTFEKSGYDKLVAGFKGSSVPVFYSEYGCNDVTPRPFTEVSAIYGPQMTDTFSGGVVYEYVQERNNYGLVEIDEKDGSVKILTDFYTFRDQLANLDFTQIQGAKPPSGDPPKAPVCDSKLITTKGFNGNFTLPEVPPGAPEIIAKGVSPKPVGKLVDISNYKVTFSVKNPDDSSLTNLEVKPIANDGINQPGSNTAEGTTPTGTSAAPAASSSKAAAGRQATAFVFPAVAMGAFAFAAGITI
ncbi:Glucanosyltransferase-domain-containing protein [Apodospora peruviana]|uniref:1,3-beta-glucanosyltransferase n=1 Tax=Apodospora peruviana TaxID=516989 RepID=A0AAE0I0K1_9PEZI|nr:Glucanosyltransferase-domain-containing protein [Apodospora peruviana]